MITAEILWAAFLAYGIEGLMAVSLVYLAVAFYRFKQQHKDDKTALIQEVEKLRSDLDHKDTGCTLHAEHFQSTFARLDTLEKGAVKTDRDMKTVYSKMEEVAADVRTVSADTKQILLLMAKRGTD